MGIGPRQQYQHLRAFLGKFIGPMMNLSKVSVWSEPGAITPLCEVLPNRINWRADEPGQARQANDVEDSGAELEATTRISA